MYWDAGKESDRAQLRDMVGPSAEALVYLFGTVDRGSLIGLSKVINRTRTLPEPLV